MLRLAHAPLASNKVRAVPMPANMIIYLPLYQIILVFCNTQHNHPIESKPNINNNSSEQTLFSNSFFFRHPTKHHRHLHAPRSGCLFCSHPPSADLARLCCCCCCDWCCREKAVVHVWLHNRFADAHTDCVACARTRVVGAFVTCQKTIQQISAFYFLHGKQEKRKPRRVPECVDVGRDAQKMN